MDFKAYDNAYKLALKDSKYMEQKGGSPYLLSFDELDLKEAYAQKDLGLWDLPIERLVGTFTSTRKNTFSPHFYPLLEKDTEFAFKWQNLHKAHEEEGIRDPLKVLLYEGKFFVVEGHKRCSVLRSSEANRVTAQVYYVMPLEQSEERKRRDQAFLHFTQLYKAQFFFFPTAEHYKELWQCIQKIFNYDFPSFEEAKSLPEEEAMDLRSLFQSISKLLDNEFFHINYELLSPEEMVAHKEKICLIFLRFLKIFGFSKYKDSTEKELKALIEASKAELFEEKTHKKLLFLPPLLENTNAVAPASNYAHYLGEKLKDKAALVNSHEEHRLIYQSSSTLKHKLDQKLLPILLSSGNFSTQATENGLDLNTSFAKLCTEHKVEKIKALFIHKNYAKQCKDTAQHEQARLLLEEKWGNVFESFSLEGIGVDKDIELALIAALTKKVNYLFICFELDEKTLDEILLHFSLENPHIHIFYMGFNTKYSTLTSFQLKRYELAFLEGLALGLGAERKTNTYTLKEKNRNHFLAAKAFAMGYHLLKAEEKLQLQLDIKDIPCEEQLQSNTWLMFYTKLFASLASPKFKEYKKEHHTLNIWWGLAEHLVQFSKSPQISKELSLILLLFEEKLKEGALEIFPPLFLQEFLNQTNLDFTLLKNDFELSALENEKTAKENT